MRAAARWEEIKLPLWRWQGRLNAAGYLRTGWRTRPLAALDVERAFPHLQPGEAAEIAALLVRPEESR